jgi:hypothetical protein
MGQCGFPQSLQVNSGTAEPLLKLRYDSFLPQALQSINHQSAHHSMLHDLNYGEQRYVNHSQDCIWRTTRSSTPILPRRSLLSEYRKVSKNKNKCDFSYTHKEIMAFPAPTVLKFKR